MAGGSGAVAPHRLARAPTHTWDLATLLPVTVAALSAAAAGIHGSVVSEHAREFWLFGLFFAVAAGLQLLWAYLVLTRPSAAVLLAGALGNALVVAVWVGSRTTGLPLGPGRGVAEPVSFADGLTSVLEVGIVAASLALALRADRLPTGRPVPYLVALGLTAVGGMLAVVAMATAAPGSGAPSPGSAAGSPSLAHGTHLVAALTVGVGYVSWRLLRRGRASGRTRWPGTRARP